MHSRAIQFDKIGLGGCGLGQDLGVRWLHLREGGWFGIILTSSHTQFIKTNGADLVCISLRSIAPLSLAQKQVNFLQNLWIRDLAVALHPVEPVGPRRSSSIPGLELVSADHYG